MCFWLKIFLGILLLANIDRIFFVLFFNDFLLVVMYSFGICWSLFFNVLLFSVSLLVRYLFSLSEDDGCHCSFIEMFFGFFSPLPFVI